MDVQENQPAGAMPLADVRTQTDGFVGEHNAPCPVCRKNHAVWFLNAGTFHPCQECEQQGWMLVRAKTKFQRWLLSTFFKMF